ncbi:MAG: glycosyltransferase [Chloroflexota bacterium]
MTRVLLAGGCPLPVENQARTYSVGMRTWQFAAPLLADGHEVCLVASRLMYEYPAGTPDVTKTEDGGLTYYSVTNQLFAGSDFVQRICDDFQPDCIVGANSFPSYVAAGLRSDKPLWADLNGHLMTEAQTSAAHFDDDKYLLHHLNFEAAILRRADAISVTAVPQLYATLGEMGLLGRLNKRTVGHEFIHCIPNALEPVAYQPAQPALRGVSVEQDDFVVLWSGGYNTWADVDTLFAGLEKAMSQRTNIRFVSTGGQIDGHDERTYARFQELVQASPYASRFILKGWLPRQQLPDHYLESDVAVVIDKNTLEPVMGTRTRIYDWSRAALPTLATNLCDLIQAMSRQGVCYTVPTGDPETLAAALLYLAEYRQELKETGQRARQYLFENFTLEKTTEPLRSWVQAPGHAPDWGVGSEELYRLMGETLTGGLPRLTHPWLAAWRRLKQGFTRL